MTTYSDIILATPGLTGYWRLGEASGTTATAAHGGIDGTIAGSPTMGTAGLLTGDADTAITFDGSDDVVACGVAANFAMAGSVTLEAWVKTGGAGASYRGIMAKNSEYGMFALANELIVYDFVAAANRQTGFMLNDNAVHHVVASLADNVSNGSIIVADGDVVWTGTYNVWNTAGTHPLRIGGNTAGQNFAGIIDEVAVYNVALDLATIQEHYDAGLGIFPPAGPSLIQSIPILRIGQSHVGPLRVGRR